MWRRRAALWTPGSGRHNSPSPGIIWAHNHSILRGQYTHSHTHSYCMHTHTKPKLGFAICQVAHHLLQVSQDGKSLLDKLQRPLTPGSADSLMASANYSKAVHHVLDIIHEVLHHQRQLENIWQHRKVRLHQRLQLCVFQQDVQQVRDTCIQCPTSMRPAAVGAWAGFFAHVWTNINTAKTAAGIKESYPVFLWTTLHFRAD